MRFALPHSRTWLIINYQLSIINYQLCRFALRLFFVSPASPTTDRAFAMPAALPLRSHLRCPHPVLWATVLLRFAMPSALPLRSHLRCPHPVLWATVLLRFAMPSALPLRSHSSFMPARAVARPLASCSRCLWHSSLLTPHS